MTQFLRESLSNWRKWGKIQNFCSAKLADGDRTSHSVNPDLNPVSVRQGSIAKKPYNPVIGETFRCSWKAPVTDTTMATATAATTLPPSCHGDDGVMNGTGGDQTAADGQPDESPEEEDGERGRRANLFYCAEQVSHHPPSGCSRSTRFIRDTETVLE